MINNLQKISRGNFLKRMLGLVFLPYALLLAAMVSQQKRVNAPSKLILSVADDQDVIFHDEVILIKNNQSWLALSSRCTHLGCKINKIENDQLVCPCHGSAYDLNGEVLRGPSLKPLNSLPVTEQKQEGKIIIEL